MTATATRTPKPRPWAGGLAQPAMRPPVEHASSLGRWVRTPAGGLTLLIVITLCARLLFAAALGLGLDESYMVASGRIVQLSYFDHPPLAWWMAWAAANIAGTDAAWVVRLPFVLTFALTTWLMFRLTSRLFGATAGLWAAVLLNMAPVLGVTTASWVLPDGPLLAALLAAAICLVEALGHDAPASRRAAWAWWLAAGAFAGVAMLSKYSAVLTIAGLALYLLTAPGSRPWLARPQPYAAGLLALAVFAPVLVWNAQHGWVSLLFQGGRAGPGKLHPFGPLTTLAGEALFMLPWIWAPLVVCGAHAIRRGPRDGRSWLLVCLALPPLALFTIAAFWARIMLHWADPGYLMLFPLLGASVARSYHRRVVRIWLWATAAFVLAGAAFVASEVRYNWLPTVFEDYALGTAPDLDAVDWVSLRTSLAERGLLTEPGLVFAATRWFDAGKVDYALGGTVKVICLGSDPRQYGMTTNLSKLAGRDVLIVAPRTTPAQIEARYGPAFDSLETLAPVMLRHAGRPAMLLPLYLGHGMRAAQAGTARG